MMTRTIEYIKGTSLPAACSTLHIRQTNQRVAFPRYITFLVATSTQFWNVQCHQPTRPMAVKEKSLPTSPYAWSPLYNVICWKSSYFFYSSSALPSFGFSSMLSSPPPQPLDCGGGLRRKDTSYVLWCGGGRTYVPFVLDTFGSRSGVATYILTYCRYYDSLVNMYSYIIEEPRTVEKMRWRWRKAAQGQN